MCGDGFRVDIHLDNLVDKLAQITGAILFECLMNDFLENIFE